MSMFCYHCHTLQFQYDCEDCNACHQNPHPPPPQTTHRHQPLTTNTAAANAGANADIWECTTCSFFNDSDRDIHACVNCNALETRADLRRCRIQYLFGCIAARQISLLPPPLPFFIYAMSKPTINITTKADATGIFIIFHLKMENNHNIHIDECMVQMTTHNKRIDDGDSNANANANAGDDANANANNNNDATAYLCLSNETRKRNTFPTFIATPFRGKYSVSIKAKCADRISPIGTVQFVIRPKFHFQAMWAIMFQTKHQNFQILKTDSIDHSRHTQSNTDEHKDNGNTNTNHNHGGGRVKYGDTQFIELAPVDDEYQTVCNQFLRTGKMRLSSSSSHSSTNGTKNTIRDLFIYKICNEELSDAYQSRKQQMSRALDDANNLNEVCLWHGTEFNNVSKICTTGFLRQFTKRSVYGLGVYFARNSSYSASMSYSKPDSQGFQFMLYCTVLCGEWCLGNAEMKIPDRKPTRNRVFESSVNNVTYPTIFVTYKDDQALPMHVIAFRTEANARAYS